MCGFAHSTDSKRALGVLAEGDEDLRQFTVSCRVSIADVIVHEANERALGKIARFQNRVLVDELEDRMSSVLRRACANREISIPFACPSSSHISNLGLHETFACSLEHSP